MTRSFVLHATMILVPIVCIPPVPTDARTLRMKQPHSPGLVAANAYYAERHGERGGRPCCRSSGGSDCPGVSSARGGVEASSRGVGGREIAACSRAGISGEGGASGRHLLGGDEEIPSGALEPRRGAKHRPRPPIGERDLSGQGREGEGSKADLEDDWDLALEEARYAAAVRVRDATAKENASRGTTFSFFDAMFPPLDDAPQVDDPCPQIPVEAAQSTNRPLDGEATGGLGVPPPETDEEQVDFGSD